MIVDAKSLVYALPPGDVEAVDTNEIFWTGFVFLNGNSHGLSVQRIWGEADEKTQAKRTALVGINKIG